MSDSNLDEMVQLVAGLTVASALSVDEAIRVVSDMRGLNAIVKWAQGAPHYYDCAHLKWKADSCTCGKDEAFKLLNGFKE